MSGKIHFKITHDGLTRRFALSRDEKYLVSALKDRVLKITGTNEISLYWKDEDSDIVLESEEDLETAIDFAQTKNKLGCITLEIEETDMEEKKRDETKIVTAAESAKDFGGFSFMCDSCSSYLARSNGGRYKCVVCEDYDLCAACIQKGKHETHAFVRLLDGLTIVELKKNKDRRFVGVMTLARSTPRCSPIFVLKGEEKSIKNENGRKEVENTKTECNQKGIAKEVKKELVCSRAAIFDIRKETDNVDFINGIPLNIRAAPVIPIEVLRQQLQERVDAMQQMKKRREQKKNNYENMCMEQNKRAYERAKKEEEEKKYSRNEMMKINDETEQYLPPMAAFVDHLSLDIRTDESNWLDRDSDFEEFQAENEAIFEGVEREYSEDERVDGELNDRVENRPYRRCLRGSCQNCRRADREARDREIMERHGDRVAFETRRARPVVLFGSRREGVYTRTELPPSQESTKTSFWKRAVVDDSDEMDSLEAKQEAAYKRASQIPAHMTVELIEFLLTLEEEEMEEKLAVYRHVLYQNVATRLFLDPIFTTVSKTYNDKLIGNIAVDLMKHLKNLLNAVRMESSRKTAKVLNSRLEDLKEALVHNGADGDENIRIAKKLCSILLTTQYDSSVQSYCRSGPGRWYTEAKGFMEADPRRKKRAPPRVASTDPHKEGLFAPFPEGCLRPRETEREPEWPLDDKLNEAQKRLLDELVATDMFRNYVKMVWVCRRASGLDEAIDMMLK